MLWIQDARELYDALPTTHTGVLGEVEGIAHELAHQLEAGRNFEWRLDAKNMDGLTANEHEASALRIEVCGLRALGIRVSLRRLWADAAWRGDLPTLTPRALTPREQKCVDAFVRIVGDTVTKLKPMTLEELKTEALYYLRPGTSSFRRKIVTAGELFERITGRRGPRRARIEHQIYNDLGRALQGLKRDGTVVYLTKVKGGPGWRLK